MVSIYPLCVFIYFDPQIPGDRGYFISLNNGENTLMSCCFTLAVVMVLSCYLQLVGEDTEGRAEGVLVVGLSLP